jgi:hypothetical protein
LRKKCIMVDLSTVTIDVSFIPDSHFFALMEVVEALPLKKRAKWRGFVQDANGVNHKVHFIDRQLVFKYHSKWITLKPNGDEHLADAIQHTDQRTKDQYERIAAAYERGGLAAATQEHDRLVHEAATGNHRSKPHKVKVPTRPGNPVRG